MGYVDCGSERYISGWVGGKVANQAHQRREAMSEMSMADYYEHYADWQEPEQLLMHPDQPRRSPRRPALRRASIEAQKALLSLTEGDTKVGKENLLARLNQKTVRDGASGRKIGSWIYAGTFALVGMHHHQFAAARIELGLKEGSILDLEREPNNPHDIGAVAVKFEGVRVGYIKKEQNPLLAAVMDLGLRAKAEMRTLNTHGYCVLKVYITKTTQGTAVKKRAAKKK